MRFCIDDYPGEYVMHVSSREEYDHFSKYLDSIGLRWNCGERFIDLSNFHKYKNDTCIAFNIGLYSDRSWCEAYGYEVLEFSDFDWSNNDSNADEKFDDIMSLFA